MVDGSGKEMTKQKIMIGEFCCSISGKGDEKPEMDQTMQAKNAKLPGEIESALRFDDGVAAGV